jgi:DNA mismatch endonuclease (patch repair protein)
MCTEIASTDLQTSARMSRQRTKDTQAEIALRKVLHARGFRYRVNQPLPGLPRRRADMTFPARRVVVFVDGCFWHGCPQHGTLPKRNGAWWSAKLLRNIARDRETNEHMQALGWRVVRVWEHEIPADAADRVAAVLQAPPER